MVGEEGIENIPTAKARPGAWKKGLKSASEKIHKSTEIPPSVQRQIVTDIANGRTPTDIAEKYKVSISYAKSVLMRHFGSKEKMKEALTLMQYENAMAFSAFASEHITEMTAPQAVLATKLSIESGLALEKSEKSKPEEIDFAALIVLGSAVSRVEKILGGKQVKELPVS